MVCSLQHSLSAVVEGREKCFLSRKEGVGKPGKNLSEVVTWVRSEGIGDMEKEEEFCKRN